MLPLKVYNKLPRLTRSKIVKLVYGHMGEEFQNSMTEPFHHSFDFTDGHWYKLMLEHCSYNKEKQSIKVCITLPCDPWNPI